METKHNCEISVIISTYNAEAWLEKVLWGYHAQTFKNFELVIADDGSGPATKALLQRMQSEVSYPIVHVWQEDDGFQKSRILNKAITQCSAKYIVMSDGDCIPRNDFLEVHSRRKEKGYFLSGGYFMLPMSISETISREDIESGRCFDLKWLKELGLKSSFKNNKLTSGNFKAALLNTLTPTGATWNGHNASGWKEDIEAVNGFDERMQYGGQDRELGERLMNYGIKGKQIRYSAICVHLDHARGYKTPESIAKNQAIRQHTRSSKSVWTPYGMQKDKA
ncbi:glycosyltransferase family 2 protein [Sinomicrobium sp.]